MSITINNNIYLTPEYILSKVSDEFIYRYYLKDNYMLGGKIHSPFREDKNPSFSLYLHNNNKIYWKDFATGEYGTVFNLVMKLYNLSFKESLYKVYKDIIEKVSSNDSVVKSPYITPLKKSFTLSVKYRNMDAFDYEYWGNYGISKHTLEKYNVRSADTVLYNGNIWLSYRNNNPLYVYKEKDEYKFYFPKAEKEYKWYGNMSRNHIHGLNLITDNYDGKVIFTKSLKDIMSIDETTGYKAISPIAEGIIITSEHIEKISRKINLSNLYSLFDFDLCGINQTQRLRKQWGIDKYMFMTNNRFIRRLDYSDYVYYYGIDKAVEQFNKLIQKF